MDGNSLTELPVDRRRGCWQDDCGNTWEAVLLAGGLEVVSPALKRVPEIGLVKRDVTAAVLAGTCPVPDGRWALLVELTGSDWVHFADPTIHNPFLRDHGQAERLAKESGLRVLQTGYQKTAGATYVSVRVEEEKELYFESTGAGFRDDPLLDELDDELDDEFEEEEFDFDRTLLTSADYAKDWWKQFNNEEDVQQALLRDLDAYVPFVQAYPQDGKIALAACHEDAVLPEHVKRIDLIVFGPTASAEPNPASKKLADAIGAGDLAGVEAALNEGADLQALAGMTCSPLSYAIQQLRQEYSAGLPIVASLLAAGASAHGDAQGNSDPPLIDAVRLAKAYPRDALEVINLLLDNGAGINKAGKQSFFGGGTPILEAVQVQSLAAVMLLHERGADLSIPDMVGNTPRARAEGMLQSIRDNLDDDEARRVAQPIEAILEYLRQAESGGPVGDWRAQAVNDRTTCESSRRRLLAAGEKFKREMERLGGQLDEVEAAEKTAIHQAIKDQPDTISLSPLEDENAWHDTSARDDAVDTLEDIGFVQIGDFCVQEIPSVLIRALVEAEHNVFAAVCQHPMGAEWVDLVRFHHDGTTLTVTNAEVASGLGEFDDDRFERIYLPGNDAQMLWSVLLKKVANQDAEPLAAADFAQRYEQFYAKDIAAKKSKLPANTD